MSSRQDRAKSSGFLEMFFARPRTKGRGPSGQQPRPPSETYFNEAEEQEFFISGLDDDTTNDKFEEMLDDMNLTEEKKMPLRMQPTENKKKMLINHYKGVTQKFSLKKDPLHQTSVDSFFARRLPGPDTISSSESDDDNEKDLKIESDSSVTEDFECKIDTSLESSNVDSDRRIYDDKSFSENSSLSEFKAHDSSLDSNKLKHEFKGDIVIDESELCDAEGSLESGSTTASGGCKDPLAKKRVSHLTREGFKSGSPKVACSLLDLWEQQKLNADQKQSGHSMMELHDEQNSTAKDKKRKLTVLFGDSDEDEENGAIHKLSKQEIIQKKDQNIKKNEVKGKKPSASDIELKRMAELVVRLLMPYYKKKKISSRDLFKALARALSQHASKLTKSSDESGVQKIIGHFFHKRKHVSNEADFANL